MQIIIICKKITCDGKLICQQSNLLNEITEICLAKFVSKELGFVVISLL